MTRWSCAERGGRNLSQCSSSSAPLTFPGGDELPRPLRESVSAVLFVLLLLEESVMYTQQLVCGGSGQGRCLRLRVFCLDEGLPWRRRGLGTEWILTGRRVGAHTVHVRRGGQGHCSKGSVGRFWGAHLSRWKDKKAKSDKGGEREKVLLSPSLFAYVRHSRKKQETSKDEADLWSRQTRERYCACPRGTPHQCCAPRAAAPRSSPPPWAYGWSACRGGRPGRSCECAFSP